MDSASAFSSGSLRVGSSTSLSDGIKSLSSKSELSTIGDVGTSSGKEGGTCWVDDDAVLGAKSSSVNMFGLRGQIPVDLKAFLIRSGVITCRMDEYSWMTLYQSILTPSESFLSQCAPHAV